VPTLDLQQKPLLGCEVPRIYTPPLRTLLPERIVGGTVPFLDVPDECPEPVVAPATSLGFAVIEFSETVLGIVLDPWQRWLLIHALELREDGTFRFRKIVVLVARQNGKSTLSQVLALFYLYVLGTALVMGTAQDLDTATETWQGALDIIEELPELAELMDKPILVNGNKTIRLKTGERYKVKAANRRAGRGLTGDLIILDELREHQSWDAWAAITGTTNARPNAQIWAFSNAGDATSVVLRYLRKVAHRVLGDPDGINAAEDPSILLAQAPAETLEGDGLELEEVDDDTLGLFEWSAPPGCGVKDRAGWAQANPSLGYGRVTERTLASSSNDPEWVWRTEGLCQWSDGNLEGPFPAGAWEDCQDPESRPRDGSPVVLCLDVSWDRSTACLGIAGVRDDGLTHVEVIATSAGTEWVLPWLASPLRDPRLSTVGIVVQKTGAPASSMIEALEGAGRRVIPWSGADLGAACGAFYDLVREHKVRHRGQPILNVASATATTRKNLDAWAWDRKGSPVDISSLVAVTGASWFVTSEIASAYDVLDSVF
jgi:hypothetical protein